MFSKAKYLVNKWKLHKLNSECLSACPRKKVRKNKQALPAENAKCHGTRHLYKDCKTKTGWLWSLFPQNRRSGCVPPSEKKEHEIKQNINVNMGACIFIQVLASHKHKHSKYKHVEHAQHHHTIWSKGEEVDRHAHVSVGCPTQRYLHVWVSQRTAQRKEVRGGMGWKGPDAAPPAKVFGKRESPHPSCLSLFYEVGRSVPPGMKPYGNFMVPPQISCKGFYLCIHVLSFPFMSQMKQVHPRTS